jgi:pyruvate formate lyase activating enzyme
VALYHFSKAMFMKSGRHYEALQRYQIKCTLCPHFCIIGDGKTGRCGVRENREGEMAIPTYGAVSSMGFDPIEKKPLYHFYPGKIIFSVGSFGCNLKCRFCQNWEISQTLPEGSNGITRLQPHELVKIAQERRGNIGIAFTYNEPSVWFEFMYDIAELSQQKQMKNVMITNGFITPEPLDELLDVMDAFNVDLKAFTEDFYRTQTLSKLEPVKETIKAIRRKGRHLEITNLIIPGLNDRYEDFSEMVKWISGELGHETVLHLSRYFPNYRLSQPPTPTDTLNKLYLLARKHLDYVYMGNVSSDSYQQTHCPECNHLLIERSRHNAWLSGLGKNGRCLKCNKLVPGCF